MIALRRYDWILHMATIAIGSYFVAQTLSTYLGGLLEITPEKIEVAEKPPEAPTEGEGEGDALENYQSIEERNIFNSSATGVVAEGTPEETVGGQGGEVGPAVKTSLDIKLLGTLVVGEGTDRRSSATVGGGKGSKGADVYYPGDERGFAPNVKLLKVSKDRIEFLNGGRPEFAELEDFAAKKSIFASAEEVHGKKTESGEKTEEKAPAVEAEGGKIVLDQKEIDEALQNLDKLYSEIRIVPNFKGGKSAGMKVLSVKPGSVVSKLGIKRGDILEKINGQDLDIKQGMELFTQMKDMKSFSLDVVRGGKNQTLEYEIR